MKQQLPLKPASAVHLLQAGGILFFCYLCVFLAFFLPASAHGLPPWTLAVPTAPGAIIICLFIAIGDHLAQAEGRGYGRTYRLPRRQRWLGFAGIGVLLGIMVLGVVHNTALASEKQDTQAAHTRALVLRAGLDQEQYLKQAGQYADNMASLSFIDPGLGKAAAGENVVLHLGSLDGKGFSVSAISRLEGFFQPHDFSMTYGLRYQNGSFNTSCDAPGHTGCTDSSWTLSDHWQQRLQGPAVDAAGR